MMRATPAARTKLELEALLRARVARVRRIEVSEPRVLMSSMLRGYAIFRTVVS